tara:strand:- start:87 stop:347 length:261 start_codon:yes stop_codon:yes gene_type:complete
MADMTRSHYQNVAKALLREGQRIQAQKNRWAEERHGEHELTPLQQCSINVSQIVLKNISEDLIEIFNNQYSTFREDSFRIAITSKA